MSEPDLDISANQYATCPYRVGIEGAYCISGCWEEPRCITEEPHRGWQLRDAAGRFIPDGRSQMKTIAQERWDTYQANSYEVTPQGRRS